MLSVYRRANRHLGKGRAYEILFAYVFLGLAVLSKLIGVVFRGWCSFRSWSCATLAHDRRGQLHLGIPILLVTVPWFPSSSSDRRLLAQELLHVTCSATPPTSAIITGLLLPHDTATDFLPWTIFAIPALSRRPYRQALRMSPPNFVFAGFAIFLFFTISDATFICCRAANVALLVACYWDRKAPSATRKAAISAG
jgi:hypothetical protein